MEEVLHPSPARVGVRNVASRRRGARLGVGKTHARIALVTCLYVLAQALLPHLHWGQAARLEAAVALGAPSAQQEEARTRLRSVASPGSEHHESSCAVCQARAQSAKFLPSPAVQLLHVATRSSAIAGAGAALASAETGAKSARAPPLLS